MPTNQVEEHIQELRTWDVPQYFLRDGLYLIIGDTGAGKTTWTEIIFQLDPNINICPIIVMCGSEKVRANWIRSIARLFVIDPNVDFLKGMIVQQNEHIARYAELGLELPDHLRVNLILDDIALFDDIMSDKTFAEFVACTRNLGIRIFVLAQYIMQIKKKNRKCWNGVAICGPQDPAGLVLLHSLYANFMAKAQFIACGMTYTKNHGLLMIDRKQQECFKMTMTYPFKSIPFGPPSQKIYSDEIIGLLEIKRKKEALQKREGNLLGSNSILDTNGWKRFIAENGKTFLFTPNEPKKLIEFFIDNTIDAEDWICIRNYNIFYDSVIDNLPLKLIEKKDIGSATIKNNESDSDTTISDSSND